MAVGQRSVRQIVDLHIRVQLPAVTPCLRDQEADCAAPLRQCASNAPVVRIHPQTFIQELSEVLSVIWSYSFSRVSVRLSFFSSHSQTIRTFHPISFRADCSVLSRSTFFLNFSFQKDVFVDGVVA